MDTITLAIIVLSQLTYRVYCNQCVNNTAGIRITTSSSEAAGTANTLLSISESFRNGFFSLDSTSYDKLRNDIHRIYSGDDTFNEFSFVGTAIHYCEEATFLAAFVLTISILLPCMLLVLWCLWEKCSDSVDDSVDEEEFPNKHLSMAAHVISWVLACSVVILLIAMAIFAIILIIGNEKVGVAVTNSKSAVKNTLPTIDLLHDNFFKAVNETLVIDYQSVNDSIYQNELRYIDKFLSHEINTSLPYRRVDDTVEVAVNIVMDIGTVNEMLSGLLVFHGYYLETLNVTEDLVNLIGRDLASVIQVCNHSNPCDGIEIGLAPVVSGSNEFINNSTELLRNISNTIQDIYNIVNNSGIHNGRNIYNDYVQEIVCNVSESVLNTTQFYLNPVNTHVNEILDRLYDRLGRITYGLPRSQQLVEQALGERYVSNWDEFRLLATIAFSLSFFVFLVGVILAIIRGIINTSAIYLYGEDPDYIIGAHMAATTLKSFMTWIAVVGVVSAFFFVFTLCLAGLVGRGCGNHGNYSELIDDVIDNNETWGGVNVLGVSYYNDPNHSLSLKSIIDSCSKGQSAAMALQLNQLIDLEGLVPTEDDEEKYFKQMKETSFLNDGYYVLQDATDSLLQYHHVVSTVDYPWNQYTTVLSDSLLSNSSTTGLDSLIPLLNSMLNHSSFHDSFSASDQEFLFDIVHNLTMSVSLLNETMSEYEAQLNKARSNTSSILIAWERASNTTPNLLVENNKIETELVNVIDKAVVDITIEIATNISKLVKTSLSSSVDTVYCETSICTPVAYLFSNFTHATCNELVQGLDIYWATLLLIFVTSDIAIVLMITLACHLADKDVFRRRNNPKIPQPYYHSEHVIGQLISIAWLVLVFGINIWFVVALAMDEEFASCDKQGSPCCSLCYWLCGGMFLLMCALTCLILKVYQLIVLRRIRAYRGGVKAQQVQRYWLVRLRASIFYEGLLLFFLLYIPFTAISGSYITVNGVPTAPSFASLVVSLFGMLTFLVAMFNERGHIIEYLNLLQSSLSICCQDRDQHSYPTPAVTNNSPINGDVMGNGAMANRSDGDGQLTTVNPFPEGHVTTELDHTHQYNNEVEPVEIPIIREHEANVNEVLEEETTFNGEPVMEDSLPAFDPGTGRLDLEPFDENETEEQGNLPTIATIAEEPVPSILLDGLNHNEGFQRAAIDQDTIKNKGGVRLAHAYLSQQTDGSTPRSSLYTSNNSVNTGGGSELPPYYFHSTSHIPGYTSTDESSYRDDYDSYESDYTTNYYTGGQFDGKQVEV